MAVLLDTNILLAISRDPSTEQAIRTLVNPAHEQEVISIVNVGELRSLAGQNGWGAKRMVDLETLLEKMVIISVDSDFLISRYVEIDVYSQGKNPKLMLPGPNKSARNMGKNDLWIAATASLFNLRLVTTDGDFEHLDPHFIRLSQFSVPLL